MSGETKRKAAESDQERTRIIGDERVLTRLGIPAGVRWVPSPLPRGTGTILLAIGGSR